MTMVVDYFHEKAKRNLVVESRIYYTDAARLKVSPATVIRLKYTYPEESKVEHFLIV